LASARLLPPNLCNCRELSAPATVQEKGITIVPLKVYLKNGFAKVLIGVAEGKKQYDKRETIKKRDQERDIRRIVKNAR